jgi:hypothetical protein
MTKTCSCVTVHRPVLTAVIPFGEGKQKVWLCPTTYQAVLALGRLYEEHGGKPPWKLRRPFPEYARRLAEKAFGNP